MFFSPNVPYSRVGDKSRKNFWIGRKDLAKKLHERVDFVAKGVLQRLSRQEIAVGLECLVEVLCGEAGIEECGFAGILERRPIAANRAIVGHDGLENATVVVGTVPVLFREHDVAALVADEELIVGRDQQEATTPETARAASAGQVELPFCVQPISQQGNTFSAVADVQSRPPHKIL